MSALDPRTALAAAVLLIGVAISGIPPATAQEVAQRVGQPGKPAANPPPRKPPSHRSLRQGMFELTTIEMATVVMLGDSLTERAQWSEITGCYFVANRGIGADDTAGVLRRVDDVIRLKPLAVFLMIGVNDVASNVPTEKIVGNVSQIIGRLSQSGAQVYLTLVLPVTQTYARKINAKVDELNEAYRQLERPEVTILDFRKKTQDESGGLREDFSIDGIHLSPAGYRVWRDAVIPLVKQHCPPRPIPVERPPQR